VTLIKPIGSGLKVYAILPPCRRRRDEPDEELLPPPPVTPVPPDPIPALVRTAAASMATHLTRIEIVPWTSSLAAIEQVTDALRELGFSACHLTELHNGVDVVLIITAYVDLGVEQSHEQAHRELTLALHPVLQTARLLSHWSRVPDWEHSFDSGEDEQPEEDRHAFLRGHDHYDDE